MVAVRDTRPVRIAAAQHVWQTGSGPIMAELREEVIASLELAQVTAWTEIVMAAIAAHGGSLQGPGRSSWGPHWWELSLLQITGTGDTFDEAVREWAKCARRSARAMEEAA